MMQHERRRFVGGLAASLAAGLLGCRSEESEAPAGGRAGGGNAGVDTKPSEEASVSMRALGIVRIDFVSAGGHAMADAGELELREWTSWLRIRGDTKQAELALTRHAGDLVERPVGRFGQAVDDATLLRLSDAIAAIDWDALPEPLIGDPTANMLALELVLAERTIKREFSASAQAFMTAIWPVLEQLNAMMGVLLVAPIAALQVEVAVMRAADPRPRAQRATLRLLNIGRETVVIADPGAPLVPLGPRARWMLAAKPANDMQMPVWSPIELPPRPANASQLQVILPAAELEIATTFQPPEPGTYLLQAIWNDYAGPSEPPADVLAFMPLPATGEPARGPYLVRGAAFSPYVEFVVT